MSLKNIQIPVIPQYTLTCYEDDGYFNAFYGITDPDPMPEKEARAIIQEASKDFTDAQFPFDFRNGVEVGDKSWGVDDLVKCNTYINTNRNRAVGLVTIPEDQPDSSYEKVFWYRAKIEEAKG